jgi:hypothetical protein
VTRILRWEGCVNVRDLGGLPTRDGGETQFGVVVRADSIGTLNDDGWRALVDYGVRTAVDLRGEDEAADDPPREAPVAVVRFPMPPREAPPAWEWPSMREAYLGLLERFAPQFAGAVSTAARGEGAVVIHCAGGRDRTGLACALMLTLAGVEPEVVAADHALSDESWGPRNEEWYAAARDERERERRRRVSAPAGRTMVEVLERLGDVRAYLRRGGAAEEDLDTLVVRLRG